MGLEIIKELIIKIFTNKLEILVISLFLAMMFRYRPDTGTYKKCQYFPGTDTCKKCRYFPGTGSANFSKIFFFPKLLCIFIGLI